MATLQSLAQLGQSAWIDSIQRDEKWLTDTINSGILGVTSNPALFAAVLSDSEAHTNQLKSLTSLTDEEAYWDLCISDIQTVCDGFAPVFEETKGEDGFVSLEVSPLLAHDTEGTIAAAKDLWERVARPNLMVKIPATPEGMPAIRQATAAGINVNITLIFSIKHYTDVMQAFLDGIEDRRKAGHPVDQIRSVASFFLSRIDTAVDKALEAIGTQDALSLRGQTALATARLAYVAYRETFATPQWNDLASAGAQVQRLLWASTSVKNPAYPELMYVEPLIGPGTINTLPEATRDAFLDHGKAITALPANPERDLQLMAELIRIGVDLTAISNQLLEGGVVAFADAYRKTLSTLHDTRAKLP